VRTIKQYAFLCFPICLLLVGALNAQEPKNMVRKTFDLSFLKHSMTGQVASSHELPLRASLAEKSVESYTEQARGQTLEPRQFETDEVIEMVQSVCITSGEEEEYTTIQATDQKLMVAARPETMKKVYATLRFIEELTTRNATIEIVSINASSLKSAKAGLMTSQEVAALMQDVEVSHRQRAIMNLGQMARLDASRTRQYVVDYDVEVAEKARIADPVVAALLEGTQFGVQVQECPDGRFFMRVQGRICTRVGKDRIVQSPANGIGAIELPKTMSAIVALNAIVTPGSGFLVGSHESGNNPWLVRLISVDPKPDFGTIKLIPVGMLNHAVFSPKIKTVVGPRRSGDNGGRDDDEEDNCIFSVDTLMNSMQEYCETRMDEEHRGRIRHIGQNLFVLANPNISGQLEKSLIDHIAPVMRNVATELRYDLIDNNQVGALLASSTDEMAKRMSRQARFLTRTGSRGLVASGREWLSLKEMDVEIASGSQIADPVIDALFEGVVFGARPSITLTGDIALSIDFTVQENTHRGRIFETGLPDVGGLDADDLTHVHGNARFKTKPDKWTLVHTAPLTGTDSTFVLMARATYE
jgi:hypothetical protein